MKRLVFAAAVMSAALSACGGGGGGGGVAGAPPPTSTPVPTPTPAPSVSGDMLALTSNRGWNYQGTSSAGSLTLSTYVNPTPLSNGQRVFAGAALSGLRTTVLVDHNTPESNLVGGLSFSQSSAGYNVTSEISVGSLALVPGSPLFVSSTLTQGAVTTPYPGVTQTVLLVGTVPGASACPTPAAGAKVQYSFQGSNYTVSYVPGCGITQFVSPTGVALTLTSVGTYNIGDLERVRKVQSATYADTARSMLGLERNDFAGAKIFGAFFK
jgi:hypothetical protein